jgi:hypothetical protein
MGTLLLRGQQSIIQIAEGKSPAAKRFLPMLPEIYSALNERYETQGRPARGWVFPAGSESGCGFRAMANVIPTRWRTSFRGHGERHSDMMANMIPK